ncbi:hypothetical protein [Streptomyces sp. NPDC055506]
MRPGVSSTRRSPPGWSRRTADCDSPPGPRYLDALLDAVLKDDFAFNASRGIRALENNTDAVGPPS